MSALIDLAGKQFGRLRVLGKSETRNGKRIAWQCQCNCGASVLVAGLELRCGDTQSCGCLQRERTAEANRTHGACGTPEWKIWKGMIERCSGSYSTVFKYYGGRGIRVCDEWKSFEAFLRDMGSKPTPKHTIERINNDGNYEPGNCRWATQKEQAVNSRQCRYLEFQGTRRTVSQWAAELEIPAPTILARLGRLGWTTDAALTVPVGRWTNRRLCD